MGILKRFIDLLGRPRGIFGPVLLSMMNVGHRPFIEKVLEEVPIDRDDVVLDVGCGGGNAIRLMANRAASVYGVDISPVSVASARRKNKGNVRAGRVSIMEADASNLPFEDGTFDLITAFETVYFWPEAAFCFSSIRKKLKVGGAFLVACEGVRPESGEEHPFEKMAPGVMRVYGREEMRSMLDRAGFSSVRTICPDRPGWLCMIGERGGECP